MLNIEQRHDFYFKGMSVLVVGARRHNVTAAVKAGKPSKQDNIIIGRPAVKVGKLHKENGVSVTKRNVFNQDGTLQATLLVLHS